MLAGFLCKALHRGGVVASLDANGFIQELDCSGFELFLLGIVLQRRWRPRGLASCVSRLCSCRDRSVLVQVATQIFVDEVRVGQDHGSDGLYLRGIYGFQLRVVAQQCQPRLAPVVWTSPQRHR